MKKNLLAVSLLIAALWSYAANARVLKIYTLDAPPLTMDSVDKHGLVGDVLLEALHRAGFEGEFLFVPWRRGQSEVERGEDLLIIPFSRIADREERYTWIAPIFELERTFATLGEAIDSIDQAKALKKVILVGMGSAQEELLSDNGIDKAHRPSQVIGNSEIEMLTSGRVDAWFNSTAETLWKWKVAGEKRKLTIGKPVSKDTSYVACSKKCSPEIVAPIAQAIESMRQDGSMQRIINHYLSN
jgi:polar amino acid transport system substrate-binding protein